MHIIAFIIIAIQQKTKTRLICSSSKVKFVIAKFVIDITKDFDDILLETKQQTLFISFHVAKTVVIQQKIIKLYLRHQYFLIHLKKISMMFCCFNIPYPNDSISIAINHTIVVIGLQIYYIYYLFVFSNKLQFEQLQILLTLFFFQIFFDLANQTKIIIQLLMK
ncbi:hypothetical protein RFI_35441 [Reticulomyxa filosa]|uniref:Transmembrane protein n=1 Tax=Reticulomyxa filosa TaxID=46433 RepID=X6LJ83_RETFI|nr:hypothetical protein RFI_35441 [Reticulomyxa filosa]|eukprot:ETO01998.1 hypothetical protein RFI_35441 [Reticulomyxa filosa]